MGFKERTILHQAKDRLKGVNPRIEYYLHKILSTTERSNCNMAYKRRIYRLIRDLSNLDIVQWDILDPMFVAQQEIHKLKQQYDLIPKKISEAEWKIKNSIPYDDSMLKSQVINEDCDGT